MAERKLETDGERYHIRVKGILDQKWADWFDGFAIASRGTGETLLAGSVPDQAALHGILGKIHALGLTLLFVKQMSSPCRHRRCEGWGSCPVCSAAHRGGNLREME